MYLNSTKIILGSIVKYYINVTHYSKKKRHRGYIRVNCLYLFDIEEIRETLKSTQVVTKICNKNDKFTKQDKYFLLFTICF